jgi:hypothetical protein
MNTHGANFELDTFTTTVTEVAHVGSRIASLDLANVSVAISARTNQQLDQLNVISKLEGLRRN